MEKSKRLYRAGKDYVVGGVCAGLADYLAIDVTLLRILWVALTLFNGVGVIVYIVCMILIPKNPEHEKLPAAERTRSGNSGLYVGVALVILGAMITFNNLFDFYWWKFGWWFFNFQWHIVWPVLLILFGVWFIYQANNSTNDDDEADNVGTRTFTRSKSQRMIGGVCGGLAEYWNIDVTLVRIGYVLATLFTAIWVGVVAYVVMLFVVPEHVEEKAAPRPRRKRTATAKKSDQTEEGGSHE